MADAASIPRYQASAIDAVRQAQRLAEVHGCAFAIVPADMGYAVVVDAEQAREDALERVGVAEAKK